MRTCPHSCPDDCKGGCGETACPHAAQRPHRHRAPNFVRIPGLFRRWEVEDLLAAGGDLQIEPGGTTDDGTPVYVVFRREGGRP